MWEELLNTYQINPRWWGLVEATKDLAHSPITFVRRRAVEATAVVGAACRACPT